MLPFSITIRPGRSLHEQIIFAVTKAIITGQFRAGDRFPSVRTLSQELKVNPNTSMKAVAALVERGLLEARAGIGTTVAAWQPVSGPGRRAAIADRVEQLVLEAKCLGLDCSDVVEAVRKEWK